jgi:serine protease inhibitor
MRDYQGVRLPYKGCGISAVAVLPSEVAVRTHGFAAAVAELKIEELLDVSTWRVPYDGVEVYMPRFTVKQQCMSLKEVSWQGDSHNWM